MYERALVELPPPWLHLDGRTHFLQWGHQEESAIYAIDLSVLGLRTLFTRTRRQDR